MLIRRINALLKHPFYNWKLRSMPDVSKDNWPEYKVMMFTCFDNAHTADRGCSKERAMFHTWLTFRLGRHWLVDESGMPDEYYADLVYSARQRFIQDESLNLFARELSQYWGCT